MGNALLEGKTVFRSYHEEEKDEMVPEFVGLSKEAWGKESSSEEGAAKQSL